MSAEVPGAAARPVSEAEEAAAQAHARSRQAWRRGRAQMEADLARTVSLLETISRVERDVANTLRALAKADGSDLAVRRLRLAEDAVKGAHAAIERSERLQGQVRMWQEHVEVVRLRHALDRAGGLLTDLACAERDIADILTEMAAEDGSELAAQRHKLAKQALAAARRADTRAVDLRRLARTTAGSP